MSVLVFLQLKNMGNKLNIQFKKAKQTHIKNCLEKQAGKLTFRIGNEDNNTFASFFQS